MIKVEGNALLAELAFMGRVIPSRVTNPIYGCVRLSTEEDRLIIECANLALAARAELKIMRGSGLPVTVVPLSPFLSVLSSLAADLVTLEKKQLLRVSTSRGTARFATFDPKGFPELDFTGGKSLGDFNPQLIGDLVGRCAATSKATQVSLVGVCLRRIDSKLFALASDGQHAGFYVWAEPSQPIDIDIVIPQSFFQIAKSRGELLFDQAHSAISLVDSNGRVVRAQLLAEPFPKIEMLLAEKFQPDFSLRVDHEELRSALEAILACSESAHSSVATLTVQSGAATLRAATVVADLQFQLQPSEMEGEGEAHFNPAKVINILHAIKSQIRIDAAGKRLIRFQALDVPEWTYLLAQMRVDRATSNTEPRESGDE